MKVLGIARSHLLLALLLFLAIILSSCNPSGLTLSSPIALTPSTDSGTSPIWFEIYFTDPDALHAAEFEGGPDESLAAAIDKARLTVDMAIYNLNLWSIRDALINAYHRGVVVRLVVESDNMENKAIQDIQDAGIPIISDQREGLMHNKFVVIDRSEVWTGSMNYTTNSAYEDNNNLLRIRSAKVAEDYTTEFNEMFVENLFGTDIREETPNPKLTIDNTPVEIYFSPDDSVPKNIISLLETAHESIYFMAFSFTANNLGDVIRQRAAEGITVAGVMDDDQVNSNIGTEYDPFVQAGVDVRRDGNPGLMHHKVIIIDKKIVITGSYNFSVNAETINDENVIVIHNTEIAGLYMTEFQKIYSRAKQ